MVAPVSGPFVKFPSEPFADNYRSGYRQKMPLDRPLAYRMYRYYGTRSVNWWTTSNTFGSDPPVKESNFSLNSLPEFARLRQHAYNQAYEKLKTSSQAGGAGWAENLAQINKSRQLVNQRSVQLATFVKHLVAKDFKRAARTLRTPVPSKVSNRKAVSQNFLEFEYGVKPVVSDLKESLDIITGDPFERAVRGRASEYIRKLQVVNYSAGSNPKQILTQRIRTEGVITVTCRATMRVLNPNAYLANQLGLIDPALPWKLIPFSFIVDWFVNVEQVISSVTDWYGVQLLNPHVTDFVTGTYHDYFSNTLEYLNGTSSGSVTVLDKESVTMDRVMGLPSPAIIVKPFKGFSIQRGAQAIALVLSVLGK